MTDETTTELATLPTEIDFSALKSAAKSMARVVSSTKGASFLKFDASGRWVYGQEDTPVEEGSLWAVNTPTLKQGFICWKKDGAGGAPLGEEMISVYGGQPEIVPADLPYHADGNWKNQISFHLMCLTGEDRGKQVVYAAHNEGGLATVSKLFTLLTEMGELEVKKQAPVITLDGTTRKTKYKKNQETPVLEFQRMIPNAEATAMIESETPPEPPEPEKAPAPTARRRRAR